MRYFIEGWHQPLGRGFGWARCSDAKAEMFFIFCDGIRQHETDTRAQAVRYVQRQQLMEEKPWRRKIG